MRMTRVEQKAIELAEKYINWLFLIVMTLIGIYVRYAGRNAQSGDMVACLQPWFDQILQGGQVKALKTQVGDYNVLYQTCIAFMTYFKGNSMYIFKAFSCIFDFLLAFGCAWMLTDLAGKKMFGKLFALVYTAVLFLPTVVLNGAYWGQCDSIYTLFIILTLYYLYKEKFIRAFVFLGIAFGFKFQAVLILPFVVSYYFCKKKFSISMFGISVLVFWLTGIVAFIQGRGLLDPFKIYANQTKTYESMYMNIPSFWILAGNDYGNLKTFAVQLTLVLCGVGLYAIMTEKKKITNLEQYLNTVAWFAWTCLLFLPAMHERYTYPLDILLMLLCFIHLKYLKYAAVSIILSTLTYGYYLFGNGAIDNKWHAIIYLIAWAHFTYMIVKQDSGCEGETSLEDFVKKA
ncbi:Mannosyltransferase related to Gpi18 [[Clostridium] polysaccharolyticum]|uniref:Mannosyltransferase related to Gpi18 n=2 Tax=[Clostridium] polysaccharolyticum TaxID=29364 RepID=A0A1I0EN31_9FIRM|nr:Mannosyltransferase related to Gpi18 [[Clostridium] polysaccharolyticum]